MRLRRSKPWTAMVPSVVIFSVVGLSVSCGSDSTMSDGTAPSSTAPPTSSSTTSTATTTTSTTTTTTLPPGTPSGPVAPVVPVDGMAPVIRKVDTTDKVVFLTIDDGIVRDPAAMDFIVENEWPVTLFLVSGEFRADPAYFARVLEVGGTISSHTLGHPTLKGMDLDEQARQICGMTELIRAELGYAGHLMRPPFGSWDKNTQRATATCGLNAVVLWNSSLWEGNIDIMHRPSLEPGDIFLTHFRTDLYDNLLTLNYHLYKDGFRLGRLQDYLPMS